MNSIRRPTEPRTQGSSQAEPIGQILRRVMRDVNPAPRRRRSGVLDAWRRTAGEELAGETQATTLNRGVLTVEVRSASLLHELQGFRKDQIFGRLLEEDRTGRIKGLRFRLGVF